MTDIDPLNAPPPVNRPLEVRWYRDPDGRVMQVQATAGSAIDLPAEWTLLPPEDGRREFEEQQQHLVEMHAKAVADAESEETRRNAQRVELLGRFADLLGVDTDAAADLLGVPRPGARPMGDPTGQMLHGSGLPPAPPPDNAGL